MTMNIIFKESIIVSGIMCQIGCKLAIEQLVDGYLIELKNTQKLPNDARFSIDSEPENLGLTRLIILIESQNTDFVLPNNLKQSIESEIELIGFTVTKNQDEPHKFQYINWLNIAINIIAIIAIIVLSIVFPPSLPLTIGLTAICFLTTAFTSRAYLLAFFRNLKTFDIFNMSTSITLAYALSLIHTLYHVITMPLIFAFSMTFMSFVMPVILIAIINVMDEMKQFISNKAKKVHMQGMKSLFPNMADKYECFDVDENKWTLIPRALLKKNMRIKVNKNSCFPVDGNLESDESWINVSVLTGEPHKKVYKGDPIPAGAINLSGDVEFLTKTRSYSSSINTILASAHIERKTQDSLHVSERQFTYWYSGLIVTGITASLVTPWALGMFTVPLMLQNITGILFAICPCTIAIAHQLPKLWSMSSLQDKGIILRDEALLGRFDDIQTIVFDKTGTLTTGNSRVHSFEFIDEKHTGLWERIYLLEHEYGREHPIAKGLCNFCENQININNILIKEINDPDLGNKGGLTARVQGVKLSLGNKSYLESMGLTVPESEFVISQLKLGYTPVYVAENDIYKGVFFIRHEIRPGIDLTLKRLKESGIKLILLTGDTGASAKEFNLQISRLCADGKIFDDENIHAEQKPETKKVFLEGIADKNCMFVCDGFNDIWGASVVTEKGGISCAITSSDQAALIADVSLNGSLDYIFECKNLNLILKKNTLQNQWLLMYGAAAFLAFILTFSIFGIGMSPLIPVIIMAATTGFTLFNSYRVKLSTDELLDKNKSWQTQWLASDWSTGLLVGGSLLLIVAILVATIAAGHLTIPLFAFSSSIAFALSSACMLSSLGMLGAFVVMSVAYVFSGNVEETKDLSVLDNPQSSIKPHNDFRRTLDIASIRLQSGLSSSPPTSQLSPSQLQHSSPRAVC